MDSFKSQASGKVIAPNDPQWDTWRAQIGLDPNSINLNNGSFAPTPIPIRAAQAEYRKKLEEAPSNFFWREVAEPLDRSRHALAEYLHADPARLILITNTTFGINLAVKSLGDLKAGSEILMSNQEYGACRFAWQDYGHDRGWSFKQFPLSMQANDPQEIVDAMLAQVTDRTRVLFVSHVTSPTGFVLPVKELVAAARSRGLITVVDGAHAPGMVPVDVEEIAADYYIGNLHKWLLAPTGSAFLCVCQERKYTLRPIIVGWGWEYPAGAEEESSGWGGSFWHKNFEFIGSIDRTPSMVIDKVLEFRHAIGEESIRQRVAYLRRELDARMSQVGLTPLIPNEQFVGTLRSYAVPPIDVLKGRDRHWFDYQVECPVSEYFEIDSSGNRKRHCCVRVSTAWFNRPSDFDRIAQAMREFDATKLQ